MDIVIVTIMVLTILLAVLLGTDSRDWAAPVWGARQRPNTWW